MYSILEAAGYTWPLNLLWSINISCLSENKMALLDLEWVSPSWYLLRMLSRWLELCKIKHSVAFVRSSAHPRGRIQGRAGFMPPPLQPADAETKTTAGILAGTPVAHCGSGFWGETGSQSSARKALSAYVPQQWSHTSQIFCSEKSGAYSLSNYRSPQQREDPNTTVSDGSSVYYTRELPDIALGANITQARRWMPSPPKMPGVQEPPSNVQKLWIIPAPSLHGQGDIWSYSPKEQLLKWTDMNKRESKIPSKPDRRGQTSARAISEAPALPIDSSRAAARLCESGCLCEMSP